MAKIISGRVKKTPQSGITSDRYEFLGLEQAEPDLGDPLVGVSSIGANPYSGSVFDFYILGTDGEESGSRFWIPKSTVIANGITNAGSITVRNNDAIIGLANSIIDINFTGYGVNVYSPAGWNGAESSSVEVDISIDYVAASGIASYADIAGIATYANTAGIAFTTYADYAGIATYAGTAGISTISEGLTGTPNIDVGIVTATEYYGTFKGTIDSSVIVDTAKYAIDAGIATYAGNAGIATYADTAGIATYAGNAGTATYAGSAGVATYAGSAGVATYAGSAGVATYSGSAGISTVSEGLTGTPDIDVGIVTATEYYGIFKGSIDSSVIVDTAKYAIDAGLSTEAVRLQTPRTFELTGDVVASPIAFDGTGNVSLAATIQPNSVGLGTDTFGDYVKNISGTTNQITVTGGIGEGSTPVISFAPNPLIGGNVTIGNDLQVNNNLNVTGSITVGGTSAYVLVENFRVTDSDIILGFATDSQGNDVSNDTTANHGGIAVASTEGNPLVTLVNPGAGETLPATYKKIMWFKAGSFAGLNTDTWLSNYAIGIGSTQFPSGTRLAAGSVQFTENDLAVVRNINASGIITANEYYGEFKGTIDSSVTLESANYANVAGIATYADTAGIATYAGTSGIATYADTAGIATYAGSAGIATYAGSAGIATYADNAGIATYAHNAGIATYAGNAGISTISEGLTGTPNIIVGIVTATEYYGTFKGSIDSGVTLENANYSNVAGIATYADTAGIATYAGSAGIATYAGSAGIATYAGSAGIATYATSAGVATYSGSAGIATYSGSAGVATYSSSAGIATYADTAGIATYAGSAGVATYSGSAGISTVSEGLTGTPDIDVGIVTATEYYGIFKGSIDSGVALETANYAKVAGVATYAHNAGIATYAHNAGIATYADTAGIATYAGSAGIATYTSEWTLGANGTSDFTFTGPGFTGAENDPTLYLTRGQQYKFINNSGGSHPFRIQSTPNGSTGTQYNDGITNNDTSTGTLTWDVQFDAPDILYYQCTNHSSMGGKIYIVNAGIASDVNLYTTGIATIGNVQINAGIITATTGIITYYGDGQYLQNVSSSGGISSITISDNTLNQSQYLTFAVSTGNTTGLGVTTEGLVFNPSTQRMGIGQTLPSATLDINVGTGLTALSIVGSEGQLFVVKNNLTSGSIFSVNDVSGIPSIDVDADGTIQLAPFGANEYVGIGTTNPTQKLDVNGNIRLRGALYDNSNGIGDTNQVLTSTGSGISWQDAAVSGVGIQSGGTTIGTGITTLNFIGAGSTFALNGNTVDISVSAGTTRTVSTYTATAGQTTFSATYNVGYVDVFLNGAKLSENEYTATNGTSIVLDTGASLNDIVEVVGYSNINIAGGSATPDISPVMMGMIF